MIYTVFHYMTGDMIPVTMSDSTVIIDDDTITALYARLMFWFAA